MGNTGYRFFITFFSSFLWFVVFVNFLGWSGGYINVISGVNVQSWSHSYFGFQSFLWMVDGLNILFNNTFFNVATFYRLLTETTNTLQFGIPAFIVSLANNNFSVLELVQLLVNLFVQPLLLTAELLLLTGFILYYALCLLAVILQAFAGGYNVPFGSTLDWHVVQSEYDSMNQVLYIGRLLI